MRELFTYLPYGTVDSGRRSSGAVLRPCANAHVLARLELTTRHGGVHRTRTSESRKAPHRIAVSTRKRANGGGPRQLGSHLTAPEIESIGLDDIFCRGLRVSVPR